jgi:hypothetical protein
MSLKQPKRNTALPLAVQKRLNEMYGRDTGLSGPELLEFFSGYSSEIESYPWEGGAPSRWQILEDCLSRFSLDEQRSIVGDLLDYDGPIKHGHPKPEDVAWVRNWLNDGSAPPSRSLRSRHMRTQDRRVPRTDHRPSYDLFLSHASEDKDAIARPLYDGLTRAGLSVWFDEAVLEIGDSLRSKIDEGLARCRFGIVILSPTFFAKDWPQRELDGLVARETASGEKAILPIWHDLDQRGVARCSPTLAGRLAGRSAEGIDALVRKIVRVVRKSAASTDE